MKGDAMTEWTVDAEEAFTELEASFDPDDDDDANILEAIAERLMEWANVGPDEDARYDDDLLTWFTPIPGTPIIAEFSKTTGTTPPGIRIKRFHAGR